MSINNDRKLRVVFKQWNSNEDDGTLYNKRYKHRNDWGKIIKYDVIIWKHGDNNVYDTKSVGYMSKKESYSGIKCWILIVFFFDFL